MEALAARVAVTQALLPLLLRSMGRVIDVSSVGGKAAMPAYGAYAGARFAFRARHPVAAQDMRGSLPTILSTRLRGPTMLTAQ